MLCYLRTMKTVGKQWDQKKDANSTELFISMPTIVYQMMYRFLGIVLPLMAWKKSAHNWPRFKLSPKCLTKPGSAPVPIFCSCKSSLQELWTSWTLLTIPQVWRNVTKTKSWSTFETKALLSNQWSSSDPNPGSNWTSMSCVFLSPYLNLVLKGYHLWGMWVTSVHSLEKWWYL